jgi:hypothetical protein
MLHEKKPAFECAKIHPNNLDNYSTSPLKPLKTFLTIAKYFGGLPLLVQDEDVSRFKHSRIAYFALCYVAFVTCGVLPLEYGILAAHGISQAEVWKNVRETTGVSYTDMIGMNLMMFPNILSIFMFLFIYKGADKALTKLCTQIKEVPWITVTKGKYPNFLL